jgi:hypothetical protein
MGHRFLMLIALTGTIAVAQQQVKPETSPATVNGSCSVANSGSNNKIDIRCGIDREQAQKLVRLMNRVLAAKDQTAIMQKLDEILAAQSKSEKPVCDSTTMSNCALNNYGNQTINGFVPPPFRRIQNANALQAIEILKKSPSGSKVDFSIVGGDKEIMEFARQVGALFQAASGIWTINHVNRTGELTMMDENGMVSHGEGFQCWVTSGSKAGEIAVMALQASGYPCERHPDRSAAANDKQQGDIELQIGTRIIPPR